MEAVIEKAFPLTFPPGMYKNGTLEDRMGKWVDGNLVRFTNGVPKPWGNWSQITTNQSPPNTSVPRAAYLWSTPTSGNTVRVACGTGNRVYVVTRNITGVSNTLTNITPSGYTSFESFTSYSHSFANYGDKLLFTWAGSVSDNLYVWDPAVGGLATRLDSELVVGSRGVFVTPERFVMALVFETTRNVRWADQDDITIWTPTAVNSAGGFRIPSASEPVVGRAVRDQTLVWTFDDLWLLPFVDAPLYYGHELVGSKCGILGVNALSVVDGVARWMGPNGFFMYDGYTRPIECPVQEYVFNDIQRQSGHRVFTVSIPEHNCVVWFYPSANSVGAVCDRYVEYNYLDDVWDTGTLSRTAGVSGWPTNLLGSGAPAIGAPLLFDADGATIWQHEGTSSATGAYIESGPVKLDVGDKVMRVQKIIPDGAISGDTCTLFGGTYPGVAEALTTSGGGGLGPFDVRMSARYIRYKQTLTGATSRVGIPQLGVIPQGSR